MGIQQSSAWEQRVKGSATNEGHDLKPGALVKTNWSRMAALKLVNNTGLKSERKPVLCQHSAPAPVQYSWCKKLFCIQKIQRKLPRKAPWLWWAFKVI